MLGVEPQTSGIRAQNSTARPTWQVRVKSVEICDQQSMPNHLPAGNWQSLLPIWKKS